MLIKKSNSVENNRKTRLIGPPTWVLDFEDNRCPWLELLKKIFLWKIKILNLLTTRPFVREHHILKCWADEKSQNAVRHQTYTALLYCIRDGEKLHCIVWNWDKKTFFPFLILHTSRHILISVPLDAKRLDLSPTFCIGSIYKCYHPKRPWKGVTKKGIVMGKGEEIILKIGGIHFWKAPYSAI